jgi:hypothetical protein
MNNASDRSAETPAQTAERYRARYSDRELRAMAALWRLGCSAKGRPLPLRYAVAARLVDGSL